MIHTRRVTSTDLAPEDAWFKASFSENQGQSCVEIAKLSTRVGIRDSKDKGGPALVVDPSAFSAFVDGVRGGAYDA